MSLKGKDRIHCVLLIFSLGSSRNVTQTSDEHTVSVMDSITYCRDLVKGKQPEIYHTIMQIPAKQQPLHFALRALICELTAIPDQITNDQMGLIRLAWWRNAVESIHRYFMYEIELHEDPSRKPLHVPELPPANPVIHALSNAIRFNGLGFDFSLLHDIIDVHEKWIVQEKYDTLPDYIADIDRSEGALYQLLTTVAVHDEAGADSAMDVSPDILKTSVLLGRATGLMALLHSLAYTGVKGYIKLPADMLWFEGLYNDDVLRVHHELLAISNEQFDANLENYKRTVDLKTVLANKREKMRAKGDLGEASLDAMLAKMRKQDGMFDRNKNNIYNTPKETVNAQSHECGHNHGENTSCGHNHGEPASTTATSTSTGGYIAYNPQRDERGATLRPEVITNEFIRRQLTRVVERVCNITEQTLDKAVESAAGIPAPLRKYMLATVPTRMYIEKLKALKFDAFHPNFHTLDPTENVKLQIQLKSKKLLRSL